MVKAARTVREGGVDASQTLGPLLHLVLPIVVRSDKFVLSQLYFSRE
ncbi:hypothetical protein GCM10011571_35650 [Marinithermofilum abyssi]|uniref:Uncharacterized protein n=1 Tax=Marinithermofilum abyssi TaxID=1571185 RepID=A0A8J2VLV7_9BACL|nr:hypothetical protein GCM10011571_35650 [Marinithermofilum abyssi]